jgi:hypothetical protein
MTVPFAMDPGSFVKLYGSIILSSVWTEPDHVFKTWIAMLVLADKDGYVAGTIPGLAQLTGKALEQTEEAIERFKAPDKYSRSKNDDGRRIREVEGGWLVINIQKYREFRTGQQVAKAERQARWRDGKRLQVDGVDGAETEVSTSSSPSVGSVEGEGAGRGGEQEAIDDFNRFMARWKFGSPQAQGHVAGFIRKSRSPVSVIAILEAHLTGEMDYPKSEPEVVAKAVVMYAANQGHQQFNAAYFAGFVRRAKSSKQVRTEEQTIDAEAQAAERRRVEEIEAEQARQRAVSLFSKTHPVRYAELEAQAEASVDPKHVRGRGMLVKGALVELIQQELGHT